MGRVVSEKLINSSKLTTTAELNIRYDDSKNRVSGYDELGNILSVEKNGEIVASYNYDNLNQLVSEVRGTDTYTYRYDNGGNLIEVTKNGSIIKSYGYEDSEWKELLTSFNGQTITYDEIGNPLTYRDGMDFTWSDGRKLSTITKGTDSIIYQYDVNGYRRYKIVNGKEQFMDLS